MEYFKNFDDIINDLRAVVPLEKPLTEKQDINIVMLTVSRVMMNIQKSSQYNFTNEEQKVYSQALKEIGCVSFDKADESYKLINKTNTFLDTDRIYAKNNIEYPLVLFSRLIDADLQTFNINLKNQCSNIGNYSSWVELWLKTQGFASEGIDNYIKRSREFYQEGKKYIYPQQKAHWKKWIASRMSDIYRGKDISCALDVMKQLNDGIPVQEVAKQFKDTNSFEMIDSITLLTVLEFSKKGPEFAKELNGFFTKDYDATIKDIEKQNKKFDKELSKTSKKIKEYAN